MSDELGRLRAELETAQWTERATHGVLEYWLAMDGRAVATIVQRNRYCDRGHWQLYVDGIPGLDFQDGFPRYYMRLKTAQDEAHAFLLWRLFGVRAEQTEATLLDLMTEEKP